MPFNHELIRGVSFSLPDSTSLKGVFVLVRQLIPGTTGGLGTRTVMLENLRLVLGLFDEFSQAPNSSKKEHISRPSQEKIVFFSCLWNSW